MKTTLRLWTLVVLLPCWTVVAGPVTNRSDEAAIIAATMPGVKEIHPTAYGYRVLTTNGTVSVYKTFGGVRSQDFEASRTAYGYRTTARGESPQNYYSSALGGYRTQNGRQIRRTLTGYDLGTATLTSNVTGYTYRRK